MPTRRELYFSTKAKKVVSLYRLNLSGLNAPLVGAVRVIGLSLLVLLRMV